MFNPYDTQAVISFLSAHASDVKTDGASAVGVRKLLHTVDARVQRHRDSKQLLKQSAADLVDSGWTRHDVVSSRLRWGKLVRQHGAHNLVHTLNLSLSDATELGITATQLLRMRSDLLGAWNVRAHDMIALGATVPQLLDRYETGQNLADMGFTSNIMQQMGMSQEKADKLFAGAVHESATARSASSPAVSPCVVNNNAKQTTEHMQDVPPVNDLEHVKLDKTTMLDF